MFSFFGLFRRKQQRPRDALQKNSSSATPAADATARSEQSSKTVWRLLELLIDQVESHGASCFEIARVKRGLIYRFTSVQGRQGTGDISPTIEAALFSTLREIGAALPRPMLRTKDGRKTEVSVSSREDGLRFLVSFAPLQVKPSHPPVLEVIEGSKGARKVESMEGQVLAASQDLPMAKVMLIEDNVSFAFLLSKAVQKAGITMQHYANAEQALQALATGDLPGLIVCDLHMHPMNGIAFVRQVRSLARVRDLPVLMLTSDNQQSTEVLSLEEGADDFVAKQESTAVLLAHMKRLLAKRLGRTGSC